MLVLNGIGSLISFKIGCLISLALVTYIELEEFKKRDLGGEILALNGTK